eukprot:6184726-Pleurochrysis_carterae.AAC.1
MDNCQGVRACEGLARLAGLLVRIELSTMLSMAAKPRQRCIASWPPKRRRDLLRCRGLGRVQYLLFRSPRV